MKRVFVLLSLVLVLFFSLDARSEEPSIASKISLFIQQWPQTWYPEGAGPETAEERDLRLTGMGPVVETVALSNESSFHPKDAAALITTVWGFESRFDYWVHAGGGTSPIGHQDNGKAKCLGQIQTWKGNPHLPTSADHEALVGLDAEATERCARVTLAYFWAHAQRCLRVQRPVERRWTEPLADYEVAILMASYGSGRCGEVARRHKNRAYTFRKLRKQL